MRLHYRLTVAAVVLLFTAFAASAQTNSVSIGTTNTNTSAVLWLNGDGKQGLIIPVGTRGNVASPVKGMIIFDTNQIYAYDGANWSAVGGGSGGSQTLTLSGNSLSISGGNTVTLATSPAASQFYMFDGTNWVAKSLSQDVLNNLGVITVNGLKGKPLPANFAAGVLTSDANGNLSWTTPSGALPVASANQILTSNGSSAPTWVSTIPGNQVTPGFGAQAISTTGTLSSGATTVTGLTVTGATTSLNNKTYTWPNAPTLTAGSVLQTDASGNLTWVPAAGGSTYSAGTGLTLTSNTFSVNTAQNISTLSNLTNNGLVKTSGGTGALSIATAGTDYVATESDPTVKAINGLVKSNGTTISAAVAGTDYLVTETDATVKAINGIVKSNGTTISAAVNGTDYLAPFTSQTAKFVYAAPNAAAGVPSFRALVASDIPTLNQNTTGSAGSVLNALTVDNTSLQLSSGTTYNGSTALTISVKKINESLGGTNQTTYAAGDLLYASAANTLSKLPVGTSNQILTVGTGNLPQWITPSAFSGWGLTGNAGTTATNFIGTTDGNDLVFKTNNTEWARINTSGKMGIGTTTPGVLLHLNSSSGSSGPIEMLRITSQTIGDPHIKIQSDVTDVILGSDNSSTGSGSGFVGTQNVRPFEIRTNNSGRMYFDATGSVGIGTTSPASKLDVSGDLHLAQITAPSPVTDKLYNVGGNLFWNGTNISSGSSAWSLNGNLGTTAAQYLGTGDATNLSIRTDGTERIQVTSTGQVVVRTSPFGSAAMIVGNPGGGSAQFQGEVGINAGILTGTSLVVGNGTTAAAEFDGPISTNGMINAYSGLNLVGAPLFSAGSAGNAGQVLTSQGTGAPPVWKGSRSAFRVFLSSILSLTASSQTIPFNTADFDVSNNFSLTSNSFTAPVKGVYTFSWKIYYQNTGSSGNYTYLNLQKNGSSILSDVYYNSGTTFPHLSGTTTISLLPGDKISLATYNGAALGYVESSNAYTEFSGFLIFEN